MSENKCSTKTTKTVKSRYKAYGLQDGSCREDLGELSDAWW